jgi:hypothetical protein
MQMGTQNVGGRDQLQQPVRNFARIERAQAQPPHRSFFQDGFEKRREVQTRRQITAIAAEMNPGEHDLLIAALGERTDLAHDCFRSDAARKPARRRDDAVRAGVIASFLNLQERARVAGQSPGAEHRHAALALNVADRNLLRGTLLDTAEKVVHAVEADDVVDIRYARHFVRAHLRVAAGDEDAGGGTPPLRAPDELPRLPIGAVGDGAGVDDVEIRLVLERDDRVPPFQTRLDNGGIVLIDLAAERRDGDAHGLVTGFKGLRD